jgi:hypothetical protein
MRHARVSPIGSIFTSSPQVVVLLLAMLCAAAAQQAPPVPNQPATPVQPASPQAGAPATQVPDAGLAVQEQPEPVQQPQHPPQPSQPISKAQAKELFRSVDEILRFVSSDTGLPIKHSVKRKLITKQSVENYVEKRIKEDKDTQKLERSSAILKKFGLLPENYDLHSEFLRLLAEQVAAYYDAKTKTVSLLDWVQPDQQKPVLAHELTHALQDQAVNLERWALAGAKDDSPLPDNQEELAEEAQAARQAVTEGQAMVVFLDYSLAPMGKDVLSAPEIVDVMRAGMGDSADSPVFARAPMFIKESLLMPYTFGVDFVRYVLVNKGKQAAYAGMLEHPPVGTRQVMQPETYLAGEVVPPLKVPDLDKLVGPDYERYDFGEMGEFDVYLLTRQYAPDKDAKEIYPHWRGGYYFAVHRKGTPKEQVALLYLSHWDSPEAAEAFSKLYRDYAPKRYPQWSKNGSAPAIGADEKAHVADAWFGPEPDRVHVMRSGSDLLVLESFDEASVQRIRSALLSENSQSATCSGRYAIPGTSTGEQREANDEQRALTAAHGRNTS